jgi:hypothetical protein
VAAQTTPNTDNPAVNNQGESTLTTDTTDTTGTTTQAADNGSVWQWLLPLAIGIPLLIWAMSRLFQNARPRDQYDYDQDLTISGAKGGEAKRREDADEYDQKTYEEDPYKQY